MQPSPDSSSSRYLPTMALVLILQLLTLCEPPLPSPWVPGWGGGQKERENGDLDTLQGDQAALAGALGF